MVVLTFHNRSVTVRLQFVYPPPLTSWLGMACEFMLCCVMLRALYYAMSCYVMLCYVMLCYVMLCYVMLCYAMLQLSDTCTNHLSSVRTSTVHVANNQGTL